MQGVLRTAYPAALQLAFRRLRVTRTLQVVGSFKAIAEHVLAESAPAHELGERFLFRRRRRVVPRLQVANEFYRRDVVAYARRRVLGENRLLHGGSHGEVAAGGVYLGLFRRLGRGLLYPCDRLASRCRRIAPSLAFASRVFCAICDGSISSRSCAAA